MLDELGPTRPFGHPRRAKLANMEMLVIPIVARPVVTAVADNLVVELTGWDNNTGDLPNRYKEG
jgi:hypothetical protein